jgi:RHS repeat-associated protein
VTTNSTTQTRGANRQNEITSVSGATTPTYDNNGNLTKDENDYRFVWDAWNREVKIKNSSNTVIATNAYDGLNHKVQVTTSSGTIDEFFSNQWQMLESKSGSNTQIRYVWSPVYVDGLVTRDRDTDANGTLDERLFALQDANWNVTGITNTSGTIQERYTETPFGVVTFRDGSGSTISVSTKGWDILHQGAKTDIIGDYDFRNRVYSPTLGRWLSNDPIGFEAGDVNTFRYVGNGPGEKLDPDGLQERRDWGVAPGFGHFLPYKPPTQKTLVIITDTVADHWIVGGAIIAYHGGEAYYPVKGGWNQIGEILKHGSYPDEYFDKILIFGHGSKKGGGVQTNDRSKDISADTIKPDVNKGAIDLIRKKTKPEAPLIFMSCCAGYYDGQLEKIANIIGRDVMANDGDVYLPGGWGWGKWKKISRPDGGQK